MNKLLSCEQRIPIESDGDLSGIDLKFKSILPIINYNKLHKLLRNLIVYSSQTIEELQIEVYVQNSDSFIEIINNCLKYISANARGHMQIIPYDLIALLLDLISKITKKSKAMQFDVDIPQFLNIFAQTIEILQIQNQFDLWL